MLWKLMRPSESYLATQTAPCQCNVHLNNFGLARNLPDHFVSAILFQPIACSEAGLQPWLILWNHCQSKESMEFQTKIGGTVFDIWIYFITLPIAALSVAVFPYMHMVLSPYGITYFPKCVISLIPLHRLDVKTHWIILDSPHWLICLTISYGLG